ncbi:hypothetical protein F0562_001835 [Nyssa sinensis]|uniref:Retrotransposon gag domain-containing protein n=1 Tax=Nyssa sinensis TaxID=561372 RepID=A0A5J5C4S6_9ASTE|nr:hypothetical protein F0562_001835 [Nyssa sinensis]
MAWWLSAQPWLLSEQCLCLRSWCSSRQFLSSGAVCPSHVFELFLKGKALWGHIDGTDVAKPSTSDTSQDVGSSPSWAVLDACIMSWLLGSVEPHIVTNLQPHRSAQSMWAYLKKVYHQDNDARHFQLEHAIAMFQHGSLSIQDYYSAFLTLWNEYADLVTADVPRSFNYLDSSRD